MQHSRRQFIGTSAAIAAGFTGLQRHAQAQHRPTWTESTVGYGELLSDPLGVLDLPRGFRYQIISRAGAQMHDGFVVPGAPDGMATFPGPYGLTVIVRNHELTPDNPGPFGDGHALFDRLPKDRLYDPGKAKTPGSGGTTTIVYDTSTGRVVREFLILAGTIRNCAGGATPWKSWITCEETVARAGESEAGIAEKDHGYNFEVPVGARMKLAAPVPLTAMGRFNHEAIAVDPDTGIVYQTEDRDDSLFYRFVPRKRGHLQAGGKLQALVILDKNGADTRNWDTKDTLPVGQSVAVEWMDMDNVEAPEDDLRLRGHAAGAARFARGEGIWYGNGELYFAATSGGKAKIGQIFRYRPSHGEATNGERRAPGQLELFIEPNDTNLVHNADNLTVAPWGDLVVCEDRSGPVVRLIGVTPQGDCYRLAMHHLRSEFAGAAFSPDGSTLFVNIQGPGLTLAITGPWHTAISQTESS